MYNFIEQLLVIIYENSFFVILLGVLLYYLIFKRQLKFIEIQHVAIENETESRSNRRETYCSDPKCVRCNFYRCTINKAKERLLKIKSDNKEIVIKVTEALTPKQFFSDAFSQNPNVFFYRELQSTSFWNSDMFEDSRILESRFDTILNEFQKILVDKHAGWKRNHTPT